jgi:phosphoribosyl-AMP cyclohydrolase / phosphoribosyl-ATP pyrophosphohydrolase
MKFDIEQLAWDKSQGLIPVIIQHYQTGSVLMLGFMNKDALCQTLDSGLVTFYSRSKKALWVKGEISGNHLVVKNILSDCDHDTLLIMAKPLGPTCHTGNSSCFVELYHHPLEFLTELEATIENRKQADVEQSYTALLLAKGIKRIAQKVGEEAIEVALAAVSNNPQELTAETADLIYHLLVLLHAQGLSLASIVAELETRTKND